MLVQAVQDVMSAFRNGMSFDSAGMVLRQARADAAVSARDAGSAAKP
jgi:hypothetical protein